MNAGFLWAHVIIIDNLQVKTEKKNSVKVVKQ